MSLFFVRHKHSAQTCPAKDPQMGQMLLTHLNRVNAQKYGIQLEGEAVLDGQHTLVLILQAENRVSIEKFMQPFATVGSVEISPASECVAVVARSGC